ncbi:MFS transporter [Alkalicoccus daliensis]|uniref:Fucose permease n=1 Tax=Alkalicoccus daliensis TaxID=745820 RepID=A0A1H0JVR4_9BACI|nr:MFS transporter [Alkalicoccus daliensis]SDO47796.1 Fucose permease [Alkalicoccus daliensis]
MAILLLIIIYLAFISLGLPDSILGAAWPAMQNDFQAPLSAAGLLFMVVTSGTILSSLLSGRVLLRYGTGRVTLVSCFLTAAALFGFFISPTFLWLIFFSIVLGLGAGSIDTGLNHYVANHYKAHHMSWLHCFWGIGATAGPVIMAYHISSQEGWRSGYLTLAILQFCLVLILFISLPLWNLKRKQPAHSSGEEAASIEAASDPGSHPFRIKGVKLAMLSFLFYVGAEAAVGLWGSSYFVHVKGMDPSTAAQYISFYYGGITVGRLITGFVNFLASSRMLILSGQLISLAGIIFLLLPLPDGFLLPALVLIGLGFAPIFPCMLHETPVRFGARASSVIMGYQIAAAYVGSALIPAFIGLSASFISIAIFPFFIIMLILGMLYTSEKIHLSLKHK